jgi:hypothetical protein
MRGCAWLPLLHLPWPFLWLALQLLLRPWLCLALGVELLLVLEFWL